MRGICKAFSGIPALDKVDFTLRRREIHALMGENGAGKSTLIKVLTGFYRRDRGDVLLEDTNIAPAAPRNAQQLGIATVYQEVNLVTGLSVAENVCLGRTTGAVIGWGAIRKRARAAIVRLGLDIDVSQPLGSYSIAIQQMIAIARALDQDAKLLILDEPTSSLDEGEVARLFSVLRQLREDGLGIVFVTHFLNQVYEVADRITVLRNGKLVGEFATADLPRLELVAKMLGKTVTDVQALHQSAKPAAPVETPAKPSIVEAVQLTRRGGPTNLHFHVKPGEVLGLAGLLGSGRTETARLLFGVDPIAGGAINIDEKPARLKSPRDAISKGFGFSSEDRKSEGIIPDLSVRENLILALQAGRGAWRPLGRKRERELADHYIKALSIATSDAEKPIRYLSGGNQQKVLIARWLAANPRLLLLDEPTRGIDVGAKSEIEKLIRKLCSDGMGIVFISSELEEIVRMSDRVIVLRDREQIAELSGTDISEQNIMHMIAQTHAVDAETAAKN